jgi:hypothetical protein
MVGVTSGLRLEMGHGGRPVRAGGVGWGAEVGVGMGDVRVVRGERDGPAPSG